MAHEQTSDSHISVMNLQEFFRGSVQRALEHQHVQVDQHVEQYVVAVLTRFADADVFHEGDAGRRLPRPLALRLSEAADAPSAGERRDHLRQLGDVALFMAGFFAGSFSRKLVDVDYFIAMGGRAYGSVAESWRGSRHGAGLAPLFQELAAKFQRLVEVLNEIADTVRPASDVDVLRQYEIWLKTGSPHARRLLREKGIVPVAVPLKLNA